MIAALILDPPKFPRILWGGGCVVKSVNSAVEFSGLSNLEESSELKYREVSNSAWTDSATFGSSRLNMDGVNQGDTTTIHIKAYLAPDHGKDEEKTFNLWVRGSCGLLFVRPEGVYKYRLDVKASGSIALKTVQKGNASYADGTFLNSTHARFNSVNDSGKAEDSQPIDDQWAVEVTPQGEKLTSAKPESLLGSNCPIRSWSGETKSDEAGNKYRLLGRSLSLWNAPDLQNSILGRHQVNGPSASSAECGITVTVKATVETAPALDASFDLVSLVGADGRCEFGFRDAYFNRYSKNQNGDGLWFDAGNTVGQHSYLAIHSLGKSKMSPAESMGICRSRIGAIFPGGAVDAASPNTGAVVIEGHDYKLMGPFFKALFQLGTEYGVIGKADAAKLASNVLPPVVTCIQRSPLHFTFKAKPQHLLVGTAEHGVFKDSAGELWLYQQGRGETKEFAPGLAYYAAQRMWRDMASNLRRAIGN